MADTEKKETRGGDEVIKKSTVTPSEKKEPETYDYSKIKTGKNLGQVDKNKAPEAKVTTKTVEPKPDPGYEAYKKNYNDRKAKQQKRHEEYVAEQKQKREEIRNRADDASFLPGVNPDEKMAYVANMGLNYDKTNETPDVAWRDMNVNDFNNQKLQQTKNTGENQVDMITTLENNKADARQQYDYARRLNREMRGDWKENVQKPENAKRRAEAAAINDAPFDALQNSYVEGVTDLSGNQLAETMVKRGKIPPKFQKFLQAVYNDSPAVTDYFHNDPNLYGIVNQVREMFDELREKMANDDYLTDAEAAVMAAAMPGVKADQLKIGDKFKEYQDNEDSALSAYMDAASKLDKYKRDVDPTYGDDRHFDYGDGTIGIKGNRQNWRLVPETDELSNQTYMVLRDLEPQYETDVRKEMEREAMKLSEEEKKELAAKLEGIDDPYERKLIKDAILDNKRWLFQRDAYVPTKRKPRGRFPWDGTPEALNDIIRQARNLTANDLRSKASQLQQADYETMRSRNEQATRIVTNRLLGKNIKDPDVQAIMISLLGDNGTDKDKLQPETIEDTLIDLVSMPMSSVSNVDRFHVEGKTDEDFRSVPLFGVDSDGWVKQIDEIPEGKRMLSKKQQQRLMGEAGQFLNMFTKDGKLRKGVTQNADGTYTKNLGKSRQIGGHSRKGGGWVDYFEDSKGNKYSNVSATGYDTYDWGKQGAREEADIMKKAKDITQDYKDPLEQQQAISNLAYQLAELRAQSKNNKEITESRLAKAINDIMKWGDLLDPKNPSYKPPSSLVNILNGKTR